MQSTDTNHYVTDTDQNLTVDQTTINKLIEVGQITVANVDPIQELNTNLSKVLVDQQDNSLLCVYKNVEGVSSVKSLDQICKELNIDTTKIFIPRNGTSTGQVFSNFYTKHTDPMKICDLAPKNNMAGYFKISALVSNLTNMNSSGIIKRKYFVKLSNGVVTVKLIKSSTVCTDGDIGEFQLFETISDKKVLIFARGSPYTLLSWTVNIFYMQTDFMIQ
jgi:hypothetical protein